MIEQNIFFLDAIVRYPTLMLCGGFFILEATFTEEGAKLLTPRRLQALRKMTAQPLQAVPFGDGASLTGYACEAYRCDRIEFEACTFASALCNCGIRADVVIAQRIHPFVNRTQYYHRH